MLYRLLQKIIMFLCVSILSFASFAQNSPLTDVKNSSLPIYINSDSLVVKIENSTATFLDNVKVKQGSYTLTTDKLIVYYRKNKSSSDQASISKIDAVNNVKIKTQQEEIHSDTANYDVDSGYIYMNDNVTLYKDKSVLRGSKLVYDSNTGITTLDNNSPKDKSTSGRVKGTFIPTEKENNE